MFVAGDSVEENHAMIAVEAERKPERVQSAVQTAMELDVLEK